MQNGYNYDAVDIARWMTFLFALACASFLLWRFIWSWICLLTREQKAVRRTIRMLALPWAMLAIALGTWRWVCSKQECFSAIASWAGDYYSGPLDEAVQELTILVHSLVVVPVLLVLFVLADRVNGTHSSGRGMCWVVFTIITYVLGAIALLFGIDYVPEHMSVGVFIPFDDLFLLLVYHAVLLVSMTLIYSNWAVRDKESSKNWPGFLFMAFMGAYVLSYVPWVPVAVRRQMRSIVTIFLVFGAILLEMRVILQHPRKREQEKDHNGT